MPPDESRADSRPTFTLFWACSVLSETIWIGGDYEVLNPIQVKISQFISVLLNPIVSGINQTGPYKIYR
jgi:hypothetical protein